MINLYLHTHINIHNVILINIICMYLLFNIYIYTCICVFRIVVSGWLIICFNVEVEQASPSERDSSMRHTYHEHGRTMDTHGRIWHEFESWTTQKPALAWFKQQMGEYHLHQSQHSCCGCWNNAAEFSSENRNLNGTYAWFAVSMVKSPQKW